MIRVVRSANRVRRPQRHDVQAFHAGTSTHQSPPVRAIGANQILDGALPCQRGVVAYLVQDVHAPVGAAQCKQIHLGVAPAAQFYGQRISVAHLRNLVAARITASGNGGHAVAQAELAQLSPEQEAGALRVAAFLVKYYGSGIAVGLHAPVDTVTTKDRLALVTVHIQGTPYVIVDIGLRMLKPHELYRAQGFPADYIIDRTANGTPLSTSAAVRMVGNSVSPPPLRALAEANLDRVPNSMAAAA